MFDQSKLLDFLDLACDHYGVKEPALSQYLNGVYNRVQQLPERVSLAEVDGLRGLNSIDGWAIHGNLPIPIYPNEFNPGEIPQEENLGFIIFDASTGMPVNTEFFDQARFERLLAEGRHAYRSVPEIEEHLEDASARLSTARNRISIYEIGALSQMQDASGKWLGVVTATGVVRTIKSRVFLPEVVPLA